MPLSNFIAVQSGEVNHAFSFSYSPKTMIYRGISDNSWNYAKRLRSQSRSKLIFYAREKRARVKRNSNANCRSSLNEFMCKSCYEYFTLRVLMTLEVIIFTYWCTLKMSNFILPEHFIKHEIYFMINLKFIAQFILTAKFQYRA